MNIPSQVASHGAFLSLALWATAAAAIEDRADVEPNDPVRPNQSVAWKATVSRYQDSVQGWATDVNLRGNTDRHTFWLGDYKSSDGFQQLRAGLESSVAPGALGKFAGSAQVASGGFVGWSLTWTAQPASTGHWAPLLGIGRTNTRPYVNLNFDPNDSWLVGMTRTLESGGTVVVYHIRDDRLGTGQRVTHAVWRIPAGGHRITLDAFTRSGAASKGGPVFVGHGLMGTLEWRSAFLRLGWDGHANYTPSNVLRVAFGARL